MTNKVTAYREYEPHEALKPFVSCFWSAVPGKYTLPVSYTDTIIPDGCSDIIIGFNTVTKKYNIIYCGIFDYYFQTQEILDANQATFGIRFFPGGAYPFLDYTLKEFSNDIVNLSDMNKTFHDQIGEQMVYASSDEERVRLAQSFLTGKLISDQRQPTSSNLLSNMLYTIFKQHGNVSVQELSKMEITDVRTINRLFENWIGLSPKKFSRIIRFQATVQALINKTDALTTVNQFGYYDQAHFINDFKKHLGKTPSAVNLSDFYNTTGEV